MDLKKTLKKITGGFEDMKEELTIRDVAVDALYDMIADYSEWYDQCGIYLPPAYASDPTGWCEALHKIKRAFGLLHSEMNGEGDLWKAKNEWKEFGEQDVEKIKELEKEIEEGLTLFGQNLLYLADPKKGNAPGHG